MRRVEILRRPLVEFTVLGQAKPGGSKTAFQHPTTGRIIVKDSSANRPWRSQVAAAGREAWGGELLRDALRVEFRFVKPRPKGHFNARGEVRPSAPMFPVKRPDVLKLARAAEDALTGVVWADDAQIVDERGLLWTAPGRC
jgi:Holliday junction resolvase RusA-like endonuclease